jgi:hypothetical protein
MDNVWFIAAIWMGLALIASFVSIRVGISVALIEILVGVAAGNIHFGDGQQILHSTDWTNFLAMLGSGVLTFLAGAEIDPVSMREPGGARGQDDREFCERGGLRPDCDRAQRPLGAVGPAAGGHGGSGERPCALQRADCEVAGKAGAVGF